MRRFFRATCEKSPYLTLRYAQAWVLIERYDAVRWHIWNHHSPKSYSSDVTGDWTRRTCDMFSALRLTGGNRKYLPRWYCSTEHAGLYA